MRKMQLKRHNKTAVRSTKKQPATDKKNIAAGSLPKFDLTIAVLSWRQPKTLRNTLESYRRNGLLDMVKQKLIFFNQVTSEDLKIAEEYGFEVIADKNNIGIGLPYQQLLQRATSKYFMFLENDFMLIEEAQTTAQRLQQAVDLLENGVDAVRFRHRYHYGDPSNYLRNVWSGKLDKTIPTLEWISLYEDPSLLTDVIQKQELPGQDVFITTSQYGHYTNNPCMYKREFISKLILPVKFCRHDVIENNISELWDRGNFRVAAGTGLFKHHPLEFSGSAFSEKKRIKLPIKNWTHYIIRLGMRRNVFNCFLLQFLPMIFKINLNIADKFMINFSLGRYESV